MLWATVHPRIRGADLECFFKKCAPYRFIPAYAGQTLKARPYTDSYVRFIPAYAGQTYPLTTYGHLDTVHPRIRGADSF